MPGSVAAQAASIAILRAMLIDRATDDLKNSLKSGDKNRAGVLRLLIAELRNKEKEKFGGAGGKLEDADALAVLQREAKKRKEAIELFRQGNREDLARKDEAELKIIEEYLPQQLSREEVAAVVDKLTYAAGGDFNSLMKVAMAELKGRADGKLVSEVVKEKLGA